MEQEQTRQQKRQNQRNEFKKNQQMKKELTSFATKADVYQIIEVFNQLRDRIMHLDIFSAAVEKVFIDKNLVSRDEIEEAFIFETKRAAKFREINVGSKNYITRLELCKEWNIDPSITQIPDQMLADNELSEEERMKLITYYDIKRLIELEENRKKVEQQLDQENKNVIE